jgi:hypothetical protein
MTRIPQELLTSDDLEVLTLVVGSHPLPTPGAVTRALHAVTNLPGDAVAWLLPETAGRLLVALPRSLARLVPTPMLVPIAASANRPAFVATLTRPTDPFELPPLAFQLVADDAGALPGPGPLARALAEIDGSPLALEDLGLVFSDGQRLLFQLPSAAAALPHRHTLHIDGRALTLTRVAA